MAEIHHSQQRNQTADYLKGIAAMFVVITHFDYFPKAFRATFPFWISMAVPIFMLVSGYVGAVSLRNQKNFSLRNAYRPSVLVKKFIAYTIPYAIVFLTEQILHVIVGKGFTFTEFLVGFLTGETGKGGYYYPLLLQFIFSYPVIQWAIRKWKEKGLVLCGAVNLLFEIFQSLAGLDESVYRLLLIRYVLVIAVGCYAASAEKLRLNAVGVTASLAGCVYIILVQCLKVEPLFTTQWSGTCMWASLYITPLVYLLRQDKLRNPIIERIGKASYDIFLVQMLYYFSAERIVHSVVPPLGLQLVIGFIVCIIGGLVFMAVERPITAWVSGAAVRRTDAVGKNAA